MAVFWKVSACCLVHVDRRFSQSSSETSLSIRQTARCSISQGSHLHNRLRERQIKSERGCWKTDETKPTRSTPAPCALRPARLGILHVLFWSCWAKLKLSHCTPQALGGEGTELLLILDLGTRWGWVVSVTPRPRFTPWERTTGTHCTGGWVGPRAGLDTEDRGQILCPCRGSNLTELPGSPQSRVKCRIWTGRQ
jgi:hypothetical protein